MAKPTCQAGCCDAGDGGPGIPPQLRPNIEPVDTLTAYRRNPRRGDTALIAGSLTANGQYRPIVANTGTLTGRPREILAGNHTLTAARELGWTHIAATWVDVDNDHAARIVAVDNRSNDVAGYDDEALLALLADLPDLDGTGYDVDFLRDLEATLEPHAGGLTDPDDVPDTPDSEDAVTRPGDVWILGDHRLVCGDSTSAADVVKTMDGERADVMVTDPPYGVSYAQAGNEKNAILGDITQATIPISFAVAVDHALKDDARIYLFGGALNWTMYSKLFDHHLRMEVRPIVWVKPMVLRPNNYHSAFEMVYFGWKGKGGGANNWHGDRKSTDVWQVSHDPDRVHPTQKPVEVVSIPIRNSCPPGGLVFEPFGGSGSTLIAADVLRRRCYALELDPAYCDVIARRWQEHTGRVPILRRDGHPDTGYDMTTGQPAGDQVGV